MSKKKKKKNNHKNQTRYQQPQNQKSAAEIILNTEESPEDANLSGSDFDGDIFDDVSFNDLYGGNGNIIENESEVFVPLTPDKTAAEKIKKVSYDYSMEISDETAVDSSDEAADSDDFKHTPDNGEEGQPDGEGNAEKAKNRAVEFVFAVISALAAASSSFYRNVYLLGLETFRYSKRIVKALWKIILKPLRVLDAIFRMIFIAIDHFAFRSFHTFADELAYFRVELHSAARHIKDAAEDDPRSIKYIILYYFKAALKEHRKLFKTIGNTILPIAAVVVLVLTVNYWNGATFALKVTYNNQVLGYIKDESVYLKAQSLVEDKLENIDSSLINTEEFSSTPKYELSLVSLSQLTGSSTISEKLIEYSDNAITNACGVYIDGDFLCAVKNETDAKSVFDNILTEYKGKLSDKASIVNFVEDIEYVQGLYPDNEDVIWDASRLGKKLNSDKVKAVFYTVIDGDTIYDIALAHDMTEKQLLALNPSFGDYIKAGDKILVSTQVKYVQVKVIKTEQVTESVDYEIIKTNNSNYFVGDNRVTRAGVEGQDKVTYLVTYINGVRISQEEVSRVRVKEPVAKKVAVGTKPTKVYSSSGSYNVSVSSGGFVWPAPSCHSVTSYYGYRNSGFHSGVDLSCSGASGKLVVASRGGTVESAGWYSSYGNQIVINHGNGIKTRYAHLMSGSTSVSVGQYVNAGQAIARVGSTGRTTGPHLHFEILINGGTVNPLKYIG